MARKVRVGGVSKEMGIQGFTLAATVLCNRAVTMTMFKGLG